MQRWQMGPGRALLVARFRGLFAVFTGAVAGGVVLQIIDVPAAQRPGAVLAAVGLAAWAAAMHRWGDRSPLVDVAGFVPITAAGLLFVTHLFLFPLLFAAAFQRGFHAGQRRAYGLAVASVVVWEVCRAAAGDIARPGTAVALGVMLVGATSFARAVRRMAERSDRAVRREHRLLQAVRTLAGLREPDQILHEVAITGADLTELHGTSAVVWEAVGDTFRAVAAIGALAGAGDVPDAVLPGQVLRVFEDGHPAVLDGEVASQLRTIGERTHFHPAYVLVPLPRPAGARAGLLLYCRAHPDDDLLALLGRFAIEVGLAEERAALLSKLAAREARLASIIDQSSDVIALLDHDGRFTMVNPSGEQQFGHRVEAVLGCSVLDFVHPDDHDAVLDAMRGIFSTASVSVACRFRTADGAWRDVESQLAAHEGGGFVLNARDVTERKTLEAEIVHRAFHDPLTGLANRALFMDRLAHAVDRSGRTGVPVGVLMVDLDDFKPVNDTHGHAVGDAVLVAVGRRLQDTVRHSDTAARLGGDEFAVLVEEAADLTDLTLFAERVHGALRAPLCLGALELQVSASIGVASGTPDESHEQLLRRADDALYAVKYAGKDRVRVLGHEDLRRLAELPATDAPSPGVPSTG